MNRILTKLYLFNSILTQIITGWRYVLTLQMNELAANGGVQVYLDDSSF